MTQHLFAIKGSFQIKATHQALKTRQKGSKGYQKGSVLSTTPKESIVVEGTIANGTMIAHVGNFTPCLPADEARVSRMATQPKTGLKNNLKTDNSSRNPPKKVLHNRSTQNHVGGGSSCSEIPLTVKKELSQG